MTLIKDMSELLNTNSGQNCIQLPKSWQLNAIQSEECISYIAWNESTKEAIAVDPKIDDFEAYQSIAKKLSGYRWIGVFDTHTHADHISSASKLSKLLNSPLIMHTNAPSKKVDVRICHSTNISTQAGPLQTFVTPGHTPDSITILWGPFLFSGDTILFGDVGRDDLPGGDARAHYESIQLLKLNVSGSTLVLPGHDHKGGRASTWEHQLSMNISLTQSKESFIQEAEAFNGKAPTLLKESLKENFK